MVCRYCQKPISITHRLVDKEFCSKQHRNAFSARSARALREMGEFTYSVADVLRDTDEFAVPAKKKPLGILKLWILSSRTVRHSVMWI